MSYVVIARKWRPNKFEDVVAQDHISTTLKNAIQQNRIASAYLFSGPRGVGKTTTARIFAKAVNCDNGPTPTPCNTCASCTEITGSRSLEVFEIDGASNRGIDEVRNLRENLRYSAAKGKHKIYIIDEVHMLTTEAFNALLKTLEEPPPNVLFIFATTEFHKVPATILSRCQRYDFRRIPPNEIADQLRKICEKDEVEIDDESLFLLAKKADGSMRDSQSLLDQVISFCGKKIQLDDLTDLLGIIDQDLYFKTTDIIQNNDVSGGLSVVEDIFSRGYNMAEFLNGLAEHFRNILVVSATGKTELLEGLETYNARYLEAASGFSETDLLRLIQLCTETAYQVKRSSSPKLLLEMALVKMIKMDSSVQISTLISSLNNLGGVQAGTSGESQTKTASPPATATQSATHSLTKASTRPEEISVPVVRPAKATSTAPAEHGSAAVRIQQIKPVLGNATAHPAPLPVAPDPGSNQQQNVAVQQSPGQPTNDDDTRIVSLEKIKSDWQKIVDDVKVRKIHLGSFLNEGFPTAIHDNRLEISFSGDNGFHMKTVEQNKAIVQEVIHLHTGLQLRLQCHKNESDEFNQVISQRSPVASRPEQPASNDAVLEIPMVKKVIEAFDGEFVQRKRE